MALRSSVSLVSKGLHWFLSLSWTGLFLLLFSLDSRHDIVDSEEEASGLDGSLDDLVLDSNGLVDVDFLHVGDLLGVSINAKVGIVPNCVLGAELGNDPHHIHTAVCCQSLGNDLKGIAN